jgi:hypothetical protein
LRSIQQERNKDCLSQAQYAQMFANANRGEKTPPYEDIGIFLPHPHQWVAQANEQKVFISKETAVLFLQTYKSFDPAVEVTFDDWLRDIQSISTT